MNQKTEKLRAQNEKDKAQLEQLLHEQQRLKNRISYLEKGERQKRAHRLIRATNQKLREVARRIRELLQGLAEIKDQLNVPQPPVLADLLTQRLEQRNAGAWSNKAKIGNLKEFSELVLILQERGIVTLADFDAYLQDFQQKSAAMTSALNARSAHMKELGELIRFAGDFKRLMPIYEEWNSIRFKKAREKFRAEHDREINLFLLAKRKLDAAAPDHRLPVKAWQTELNKLTAAYAAESEQLKPIRDELKELYRIKSKLDPIIRPAETPETEKER
ncbi:MAG: hypothetical protein IJL51_02935 [Oscillospiraceae bacterium]|nr:hypothetical protein [Oscillospiraceae bacterium]